MPVLYEIDLGARLIRTRCVGDPTFAEVVDHFRALMRDPHCSGSLDVLLDLREVSALPTPNQLREVSAEIEWVGSKVQFGACAVVATRDVLYGLSRVFEAVAAERFRRMHVFRTATEAEEWLRSPSAQDA